jgi:Uncharacterized protein conserved in bacteria
MEIKDLEQAGEMLKSIQDYLFPFSQRKNDEKLENALSELNSLIKFCEENELIYQNEEYRKGRKMLEQLEELLERQRVLDEAIVEEHGIFYNNKILKQIKIAFFAALGELMNEVPSKFKYWEKTVVDNREKALEKYVDCLRFQMSLFNYENRNIIEYMHNYWQRDIECYDLEECIDYCVAECMEAEGISHLFDIGRILGFKWEEIYKTYKEKSTVYYENLKNGKETTIIDKIISDFERVKSNQGLSIMQKNKKYADLMTELEVHFNIPLLQNEVDDRVDKKIFDLYLKISNEREFLNSYKDCELECEYIDYDTLFEV